MDLSRDFIDRTRKLLGEKEMDAFLQALDTESPVSIRLNRKNVWILFRRKVLPYLGVSLGFIWHHVLHLRSIRCFTPAVITYRKLLP